MTMRDHMLQRAQLETIWNRLTKSSGATADLLEGLMELVTVNLGLVSRVEELQSEVEELKRK